MDSDSALARKTSSLGYNSDPIQTKTLPGQKSDLTYYSLFLA
jgi:hypothetical protein